VSRLVTPAGNLWALFVCRHRAGHDGDHDVIIPNEARTGRVHIVWPNPEPDEGPLSW
jgi:hypothetical protein